MSNKFQNLSKIMKFRLQNKASQAQPSRNSPKPPSSRFGSSLSSFLGGFGTLLDASWPFLGTSRALLGLSWAPLGRSLGALGRFLGVSWVSWAPLRRLLSNLESILEVSGRVWGRFGWGQDLKISEFPSLQLPIGLGGSAERKPFLEFSAFQMFSQRQASY